MNEQEEIKTLGAMIDYANKENFELRRENEKLKQRELELMAQVDAYKEMSAQIYQAAGAYDMPAEVLDNMLDMAVGDKPRHKDILPVYPPSLAEHDVMLLESAIAYADDKAKDRLNLIGWCRAIKAYLVELKLRQQADK